MALGIITAPLLLTLPVKQLLTTIRKTEYKLIQ
jgi:hypothetical protein